MALIGLRANSVQAAESARQAIAPVETILSHIVVHPSGGTILISSVNSRPQLIEKARPSRRNIEPPEDSAWLVAELNTKTRETAFTIHWMRSGERALPEISAIRFTLPPYPEQPAPRAIAVHSQSCTDGHSQTDELNITTTYRRICLNIVREKMAVTREVLAHLAQRSNRTPENLMTINLTLTDANNAPFTRQFRFYPVEAQAMLNAVDDQRAALQGAAVTAK